MALQMDKRFHTLTLEQVQALDKVLTEVIPIHGRGNFPTLEVRAKDIIRVVKDRLVERDIQVNDIRLNGSTASHVMVRDNGMGYRDLDIIFRVELPQQEDFQVIKEVVLESLRDFLPCGVNRRKITCLTMKEAYVKKMVKVFNEHDKWSLISLSNNRTKTVGLRFVSSLRRQFEFSVDSFQIILDRMLESYWETEKKQGGKFKGLKLHCGKLSDVGPERRETESQKSHNLREDKEKHPVIADSSESPCRDEECIRPEDDFLLPVVECVKDKQDTQKVKQSESTSLDLKSLEGEEGAEDIDIPTGENMAFKLHGSNLKEAGQCNRRDYVSSSSPKPSYAVAEPSVTKVGMNPLKKEEELPESKAFKPLSLVHTRKSMEEIIQYQETPQFKADSLIHVSDNASVLQDFEISFPPPAKKTCNTSQDIVPDYCPSPKLQRKLSRKNGSKLALPENVPLLTDLSDLTAQLFPPIEIPQTIQPKPPVLQNAEVHYSTLPDSVHKSSRDAETCTTPTYDPPVTCQDGKVSKEVLKTKLTDTTAQSHSRATDTAMRPTQADLEPRPTDAIRDNAESGSWADLSEVNATIIVAVECMYGDFEQAISHLRNHLIATHSPEEIRGGGLLKYSDLLVRNFRPASETEIKSLERYMCSRFFIDFPDVSEQQRKIEAYLQCHFVGNEETSKYDYLMTLRRVIDESTVCLMGHERRQTLNMITVLALRVLGEQNAIPNTANVTCFYQPAPYIADPIFSSYYIAPSQCPLLYHPYPLHVHMQGGPV